MSKITNFSMKESTRDGQKEMRMRKQKRWGETEGATEVGVMREGEKQKRVLLDGKKKKNTI